MILRSCLDFYAKSLEYVPLEPIVSEANSTYPLDEFVDIGMIIEDFFPDSVLPSNPFLFVAGGDVSRVGLSSAWQSLLRESLEVMWQVVGIRVHSIETLMPE